MMHQTNKTITSHKNWLHYVLTLNSSPVYTLLLVLFITFVVHWQRFFAPKRQVTCLRYENTSGVPFIFSCCVRQKANRERLLTELLAFNPHRGILQAVATDVSS